MRQIKFRGYDSVGEKGWVYGDLVHNIKITKEKDVPRVMVGGYEVFEDSIGQFTGIKDMNGEDVYEGDILQVSYDGRDLFTATVVWVRRYACFLIDEKGNQFSPIPQSGNIRIIGNTFKR